MKNLKELLKKGEKRAESVMRMIDKILQEAYLVTPSPEEVRKNNELGVSFIGKDPERAVQLYFEALEKAGSDQDLQAQSLGNIGDYCRKNLGALNSAQKIFDQAGKMEISIFTRVRLMIMEAMIHSWRSENGEEDSEGILQNITMLRSAISLISKDENEKDSPEKTIQTWGFALSRLTGIISMWGTVEQGKMVIEEIKFFLPRLDQDSEKVGQLIGNMARIIMNNGSFSEAAPLLLETAVDNEAHELLPHACFTYALAAECYWKINKKRLAKKIFQLALGLEDTIKSCSNVNFAKKQIAKVRNLIEANSTF